MLDVNVNNSVHIIYTPLDVLHDKCNPALRCISFSTGASFNQGGLVGGGVELGQVLLPWDGQRNILEVLQGHRHLTAAEHTDSKASFLVIIQSNFFLHDFVQHKCGMTVDVQLHQQFIGTSELSTKVDSSVTFNF